MIFPIIVLVGELDETPTLLFVEHGKHEIVEDALFDAWEFFVDESFPQEEVDQGILEVIVSQRSQTFEDAGDAQVVVGATVNEQEDNKG